MTETAPAVQTHVTSTDGTPIAVFVSGSGRPLVLVPGTTADHTTWRLAAPPLSRAATVYAVDRRGRGQSGDGADYSLAREYDDIAAVVDAAAEAAGMPVDLLGHSFGGAVAFGAIGRTDNVRRVVLYEGWPAPNAAHRAVARELLERLESLHADGRDEAMLETFYREVVRTTEAELDGMRTAPTWPARVAAAGTVTRELRAYEADAFDPAVAATIDAPVLLMVGGDSSAGSRADPEIVAAALRDVRLVVLRGQGHLAHLTDPERFASRVLEFLSD
jgi:pimeloyl-ACP methyl ester carboxylesterase